MKTTFTLQVMNRLRLRQCALLLATDETGTLRGAAAKLGMTQPAATKMLHELESTLGCLLFEREGRGLVWNAAGLRVLAYCKALHGSMTAMGAELSQLQHSTTGKLAIGSIMAASSELISEGIVFLKQTMPALSIEVVLDTSDHLMQLLQGGELDIVIGRLAGLPAKDYDFKPLAGESLCVVVGTHHPLCKTPLAAAVPLKRLLMYPWVLQPTGSPMRSVINLEFEHQHLEVPSGLVETGSILTTTNVIAKTLSIAVIPQSIALRYEQHGLLRVLPYAFAFKLAAYGSIVHKHRPHGEGVAAFLSWLHRNPSLTM
jgi:DNA-binding transcriptional LysR family regulator